MTATATRTPDAIRSALDILQRIIDTTGDGSIPPTQRLAIIKGLARDAKDPLSEDESPATPTFHMPLAKHLPNGAEILSRQWMPSRDCWIVLCLYLPNSPQPYVVWHADDDGCAAWGHYFADLEKAESDFRRLTA